MKHSKILMLLSMGIASMGLVACQSTQPKLAEKHDRSAKFEKKSHQADQARHEARKAKHKQRQQTVYALHSACDGKDVGSQTQVQVGERTWTGQCDLVFKPEAKRPIKSEKMREPKSKPAPYAAHTKVPRGEIISDEKRAELVKRYDQRLIQQQVRQQAVQNACQGQKVGQDIQLKLGDQQINGRCELRFKASPHSPTET